MKTNLLLLLLISNGCIYGQRFNRYGNSSDTTKIFAINNYRYQVDSSAIKTDSINFVLDSIDVSGKIYNNKIETISFFKSSKSVLKVNFYLKNCNLVAADVKQPSPRYSDLNAFSIFYFESDSIFYSDYYFNTRICMATPLNKSPYDIYGYNPNLSGDQLKKYVNQLFSRLQTAPNICIANSGAHTAKNQER